MNDWATSIYYEIVFGSPLKQSFVKPESLVLRCHGDILRKKNSEKTEQVTVSDTRRLVSKNYNTTSYHRPDPSSGTMLPDVIALLYDGALPWSSIALDHGRGGSTGAVRVR